MRRSASGLITAAALCIAFGAAEAAHARPHGMFGVQCIACHGGALLNGRPVDNQLLDVLGDTTAEIPLGAFGDPDRGVGPLATYFATPGGSFQLNIQVKNPNIFIVDPMLFSLAFKRVNHTDPDFQAGNPDTATWQDGALFLAGAMAENNGSSALPLDETGWTLHTDASAFDSTRHGEQYYTSADTFGHPWAGATLFSATVSVPGAVIPGWYDLEVSIAGLDTGGRGFYEDEHFYLNVIPTPGSAAALLAGIAAMTGRRRRR